MSVRVYKCKGREHCCSALSAVILHSARFWPTLNSCKDREGRGGRKGGGGEMNAFEGKMKVKLTMQEKCQCHTAVSLYVCLYGWVSVRLIGGKVEGWWQ